VFVGMYENAYRLLADGYL